MPRTPRLAGTTVGERLREARLARNFTLEALAFAAGVSVATIFRSETGATQPTRATLAVLANALGIPVERLTEGVAA